MERIGIAASKMAKGNLVVYNSYVVLISFLFSMLIFCIAGSSILLSLIVIGYIANGVLPGGFEGTWGNVVRVCMISLTIVVSVFNLFAILRNVKIKMSSSGQERKKK